MSNLRDVMYLNSAQNPICQGICKVRPTLCAFPLLSLSSERQTAARVQSTIQVCQASIRFTSGCVGRWRTKVHCGTFFSLGSLRVRRTVTWTWTPYGVLLKFFDSSWAYCVTPAERGGFYPSQCHNIQPLSSWRAARFAKCIQTYISFWRCGRMSGNLYNNLHILWKSVATSGSAWMRRELEFAANINEPALQYTRTKRRYELEIRAFCC